MKRRILKTVMMLVVITLLSAPFAPIASYATSRAINFNFRNNNAKVVDNSTVKKVESSTNISTSKTISTVKQTTSNPATSTAKQTITTKQKVDTVKVPATTNPVTTKPTTQEVARTQALERVLETVKANTEKAVEEVIAPKKDGLEGIETSLESTIYKNFAPMDNVEVNSEVVYILSLKNTTVNAKTLHIKVAMPDSVLGTKTTAKIVDVDYNVGDSEGDRAYINSQIVSTKGLINVEVPANTEKALILEEDVVRYVMPELTTTFAVVCEGSVRNISDTKHALTPAKINAELKLLVNDKEVETGKTVELKDEDTAKYVITVVNTGETAVSLNITEVLPKTFAITKVEYLETSKKALLSEEYDGSILNLSTGTLKQNETLQIALTIEPNVNGEHTITTFAEIEGVNVKELSTNVLENTFICNKANVKGVVIKDEMFERPQTKGNPTTEGILNYFKSKGLDMKFKAYATKYQDGTYGNLSNYSYENMNAQFYIPWFLFRKTKDMFCLNLGHPYHSTYKKKIENFFTVYNKEFYTYNRGTKELDKTIPSSGTGIGDQYNHLFDEHYNEVSYILSQVDSEAFGSAFMRNLGINYDNSWDRPLSVVSPVQVSLWRLEGNSDEALKNNIKRVLNNWYSGLGQTKINEITNKVMKRSALLSAYAKAYDNYVKLGRIDMQPKIEFEHNDPIEVNGKTLIGPFTINCPELSRGQQVYIDTSGNSHTERGVYGELRGIKVTNNGTDYDKLYNASGTEISINEQNPFEFYINIKNKNFDAQEETTINVTMNNQYRNAYMYTIEDVQYDGAQHIIIGRGTASTGNYSVKVPGKPVVEYMTLSGFVWHDKQTGIKAPNTNPKTTQPPNGVFDPDNEEKLLEGIKVYLIDETTNKKVAETVTNSNGAYEFKDVVKSEYSIIMAFNGMTYEVSRAEAGETDLTKTKVSETVNGNNLRADFTDRFKRIEHNKKIDTKFLLNETTGEITNPTMPENEKYQLEYLENLGPAINESILVTEEDGVIKPVYVMYAKTIETYSDTEDNINMGLKYMNGDLSIKFKEPEVRGFSKTQKSEYNITYTIQFSNEGETATPSVQQVDFYYDTSLEYVEAEFTYRSSSEHPLIERLLNTEDREAETVVINGKEFKKITLDIALGLIADSNLKIKFRLVDNRNLRAPLTAYAEIAQYSMSGGAVDKDSEPGNGIKEGSIFYEDDFTKVEIESLLSTLLRKKLGLIRNP